MIKAKIQTAVISALKKLGIDSPQIEISYPIHENHGDYSTNAALKYAKSLEKNPLELANKITKLILKDSLEFLDKVELEKPGFINFYLAEQYLKKELKKLLIENDDFGKDNSNKNKKFVVEYSSPNIAKPFTIGHLRSTIIGDAIANILEETGAEVHRDNHVGDWGTQFGKLIYAIKTWKSIDQIEKSENPLKELTGLYVRFHKEAKERSDLESAAREEFRDLELGFRQPGTGRQDQKQLWERIVDLSWKEFNRIYKLLNVSFTENGGKGFGESYFENDLPLIIGELKNSKLLKVEKSEGALLVFFPNDKFPPLMIQKADGASLYSTRDLATDKFRLKKYGEDVVVINEVGVEQSLYFKQLFEVEEMLNWYKKGQRIHIGHGLYRFEDKKMSTRKGNTIWLEDVIKEAEKRAKSFEKEDLGNATTIAINSLKWNDLKRSPHLDVVFDWDEVLNMEGNSCPYVLYTFVRTQGILKEIRGKEKVVNGTYSANEEELTLLKKLLKYPEIIQTSSKSLHPHILTTYIYELSKIFNLFYQKHRVLKSSGIQLQFRIDLTLASAIVIKNGLRLLGIKTVERM